MKPTDKEILNYSAEGFAQKEIAKMMGKPLPFVRDRLKALRKQFNAANTTALVHIVLNKTI